jgi:hypothetical protein
MADPTPTTSPAVTEEAFLEDRMAFWGWFTKFTVGAVAAVVIILVGMAIFLL